MKLPSIVKVPITWAVSIGARTTTTSRIKFKGMPICVAKLVATGLSLDKPNLIKKLKSAEEHAVAATKSQRTRCQSKG